MDWIIFAMEAVPNTIAAPTEGTVQMTLFTWVVGGMSAAVLGLAGWIVVQSRGRTSDQQGYAKGIADREKEFQADWAAREKEMQQAIESKNRELMQVVKEMMASHKEDALRDQAVAEALSEIKGVLQQQQQFLWQARPPAAGPAYPSGAFPVVQPPPPPPRGGTGDGT